MPPPQSTFVPVSRVESPYRPPSANERIATFLPRDYDELPRVSVDPAVVVPAVEEAILQVLPEVVEAVLRRSLHSSEAFRDMLAIAVDEAVRAQLPGIARQVVGEHVDELRSRNQDD